VFPLLPHPARQLYRIKSLHLPRRPATRAVLRRATKQREVVPVRATKAHRRLEVQLHSFLSSVVNGGEWPATSPGRLITGAIASTILSLEGRLSPTDIACPYVEPNHDTAGIQYARPSAVCPVTAAGRLACLHLSIVS